MNGQKVENVTLKQLTRFYFTNHFLEQKKARNILDVIGPICGLHGQLPSSPYTALWNHIESFEPEMLQEALYKQRTLLRAWLMRDTLHIIRSDDLPIYHNALKRM